jgi:hypothetical protein
MTRNRVEQQPMRGGRPEILGGLPVRTDLRGGVCMDVDEQVTGALQTLNTALGGAAAATPAAQNTSTTTSS